MENKRVKSILSKFRATSSTYYNLEKSLIDDYKKLYSYLKKHENKMVRSFSMEYAETLLNDKDKLGNYLSKYKAMQVISTSIIHD